MLYVTDRSIGLYCKTAASCVSKYLVKFIDSNRFLLTIKIKTIDLFYELTIKMCAECNVLTYLLAWCCGVDVQPLTIDDDDDLESVLFTSSSDDEADDDEDDDDDADDDVICTDDSPVKRKSTRS